MRMTEKRINDVVLRCIGEEAVPVVHMLKNKVDVSEFLMAKKMKVNIQVIRHILYKFQSMNLATYKRVKDRQKGWYIGYWTFNMNRLRELYTDMQEKELTKFQSRLQKEQKFLNNYYICKNVCVRMNFDDAAEIEFKCPECGAVMDHQHNERTIEVLREKIDALCSH